MSSTNPQLHALVESLINYAVAKGWRSADVEATFKSLMKPMRQREAHAEVARIAKELTFSYAENVLIHAMGEFWDDSLMIPFYAALKLRFPTRHKSLEKIYDLAGDASNERSEHGDSSDYERLSDKSLDALKRLPW